MVLKDKLNKLIILSVFIIITEVVGEQANSDERIKIIIIQQSIQNYPGSCPCPYNYDRAGRRCGGRSAWSKPRGYSPLCYPNDVTIEIINEYKAQNKI